MKPTNNQGRHLLAIVSEEEARLIPYLYVFVKKDGAVRELHTDERKLFETPFDLADGNRPYIKDTYKQMNKSGDLRGYCLRSKIPSSAKINDAPTESPVISSKQKYIEWEIKNAKEKGYQVVMNKDGTILIKKPNGATELIKPA